MLPMLNRFAEDDDDDDVANGACSRYWEVQINKIINREFSIRKGWFKFFLNKFSLTTASTTTPTTTNYVLYD